MADKDKKLDPDSHGSFEDTSLGIGQNVDGSFNVYPASELPQILARQRESEEATSYAIEQMEAGFPDQEVDDLSDLGDLDEALGD